MVVTPRLGSALAAARANETPNRTPLAAYRATNCGPVMVPA
jgi:hypothetical protein